MAASSSGVQPLVRTSFNVSPDEELHSSKYNFYQDLPEKTKGRFVRLGAKKHENTNALYIHLTVFRFNEGIWERKSVMALSICEFAELDGFIQDRTTIFNRKLDELSMDNNTTSSSRQQTNEHERDWVAEREREVEERNVRVFEGITQTQPYDLFSHQDAIVHVPATQSDNAPKKRKIAPK